MARYSDAAKFRDMLAALDRQAKQAAALSAEAAAAGTGGAAKTVQFQLGQRVVHRELGYRCACMAAWLNNACSCCCCPLRFLSHPIGHIQL